MFNNAGRLLFTSTAMAPVGLTYAGAVFRVEPVKAGFAAFMVILLIGVALLFISHAKREFEEIEVRAQSVEAADRENVAFLLLYVSPVFTSTISQLNWSVLGPTLLVFAVVTATGYGYHFNPLLGILGWHAYRISDINGVTYVVFTRKQMRSTLDAMKAVQLSEYVLLDKG